VGGAGRPTNSTKVIGALMSAESWPSGLLVKRYSVSKMTMNDDNCLLSVCSFNCRSLKLNEIVISDLCSHHDIVLLQEHWLMPHELYMLNQIHSDFSGTGISAIDTSLDVVCGRPHGGTAILFRKSIETNISIVASNNSRITGIDITTSSGTVQLLNVYLPCNYGDD